MNAFNKIMNTMSPTFRDGKESKQDALTSLLIRVTVEASLSRGTATDNRHAA